MKLSKNPALPMAFFLFFSILFSMQVIPGIFTNSLTNDEPSDITNGYYYLIKGDVESIQNHPPLSSALQALPLLFLDLKVRPFKGDVIGRGYHFIFDWNLDKLEAVTLSSRSISWILGWGMGFLLFWVTRRDLLLSFLSLFFWSLDPTLLALSGLAKTDITPSFFILAAVILYEKARKEGKWKIALVAGVAMAMAVTSKYYSLVLFPLFASLDLFALYHGGSEERYGKKRWEDIFSRWRWMGLGFVLWIFILYLPATLLLPDHRWPFTHFILKFREDWVYANQPHPVYFLGKSSLTNHWYYLPVAFFLKEPMAFIVLILTGIGAALARKVLIPNWQWSFPLLFGVVLLPTPNLGVRYLLPTLPFLYLIAARGAAWLWRSRQGARWFGITLVALLSWQMVSVLSNFSNEISYFNELVPPEKKIFYLADSNLDWGQDLKRLTAVGKKRHWGKVRLAYFGGADPRAYGLDWEPWRSSDLKGPQPGRVYAVNASFFQLAPVAYPPCRPIAESWIRGRIPTGKVSDSWYYFEIEGKASKKAEGSYLASVPFYQYRGYAYPMNSPVP